MAQLQSVQAQLPQLQFWHSQGEQLQVPPVHAAHRQDVDCALPEADEAAWVAVEKEVM